MQAPIVSGAAAAAADMLEAHRSGAQSRRRSGARNYMRVRARGYYVRTDGAFAPDSARACGHGIFLLGARAPMALARCMCLAYMSARAPAAPLPLTGRSRDTTFYCLEGQQPPLTTIVSFSAL